MRYLLGYEVVTPKRGTYVTIRLGRKVLVRPEIFARFFTNRGWKIEAIGSNELCTSIKEVL